MNEKEIKKNTAVRKIVVTAIMCAIAAMHIFRIGAGLPGVWRILYYSYVSDFVIPFGVYFLVSMNEIYIALLRKWYVKAVIVFIVITFSEVMQYYGIYFFGDTFDFIDIVMFAAGILTAAFFDKKILERFVPKWKVVS